MVGERYVDEDIARRGNRLYKERIEPLVAKGNRGKYVTLDVETGDWEMGEDILALSERLHARDPAARLFTVRVGYPTASRIGFGRAGRTRP
jgi:hypothetical protein